MRLRGVAAGLLVIAVLVAGSWGASADAVVPLEPSATTTGPTVIPIDPGGGCPSGELCMYSGRNYTGSVVYISSADPDRVLHAYSALNNSSVTWCIYTGKDYPPNSEAGQWWDAPGHKFPDMYEYTQRSWRPMPASGQC